MKHNKLLTTTLFLSLGAIAHAGTFIPNATESYNTEDLHKIAFNGDNIVATWEDGQSTTYEFSSLQRILFSDPTTATEAEEILNEEGYEIFLYPNPVIETLHLKGVPSGQEVLMYSSTGTTIGLLRSEGNTLETNVSNLDNGIYFLKIGDKVIKFIKK